MSLMQSSSSFLSLNATDLYKSLRGAVVVFAGLFVLGGLEAATNAIQEGTFDLGSLKILQPLLGSGMSFLLEAARRFFTNYSS